MWNNMLTIVCIALIGVASAVPVPPEIAAIDQQQQKESPTDSVFSLPELPFPQLPIEKQLQKGAATDGAFPLPELPFPKLNLDKLPKFIPIPIPIVLTPEIAEKLPILGEFLKAIFPELRKQQNFSRLPGFLQGSDKSPFEGLQL